MRCVRAKTGLELPVIGIGTWRLGEDPALRAQEIATLQAAIDGGSTMIDTAEMYGEGASETLVGEAIRGRRHSVQLVTKIYPWNASATGTRRSAEASLRRLRCEAIDLYLLHWPGRHPLEETFGAFERLVIEGKIRHFGVSNFDESTLRWAAGLRGGERIAANQVLYNLTERGIEWALIDRCAAFGMPIIAYTPLASGALARSAALNEVARRHDATPAQIALAWSIRRDGVVAIPKASHPDRARENAGAARIRLSPADLSQLDAAFPPPDRQRPLGVI